MISFIYPTSRQFPFDDVAEDIVLALEKRNWQVPGLSVTFDVYGSGEQKMRLVRTIANDDFRLGFGRPQRLLPGCYWNDTAALSDIIIPRKELHVYHDESGPTYYEYVGQDWEADRSQFMNGSKIHSRLDGRPRTYLKFKGTCKCACSQYEHTHTGRRSPYLRHDNDLNREYEPVGDEPRLLSTMGVMMEMREYLQNVVLPLILAVPEAEPRDCFPEEASVPFPDGVGDLFCFGDYRDSSRIESGRKTNTDLPLHRQYGMTGGRRLVPLGTGSNDGVPAIAYEGFVWCGLGTVTKSTELSKLVVPGHYRWDDKMVIRVKPNRANGIYVADNATFEAKRTELFAAIAPRERLTDAEVSLAETARGKTIVPITEYRGGYVEPVVLIARELEFDEVEVVGEIKD